MNRAIAAILMLLLASFGRGQSTSMSTSTSSPAPTRFQSVDVMLDPKGESLAAYQLEFVADASHVKLVGVEGGDHAAFADPPYYDPAALSKHRVILAAFSTSSDLPKSSTRVARLHVQITGDDVPQWSARLIVASSVKSDSIAASASLSSEGAKP